MEKNSVKSEDRFIEKILIFVIVPICNAEKTLERCINSILKQIYSNLQRILVNDGSTDRSSYVCEKYKKMEVLMKK